MTFFLTKNKGEMPYHVANLSRVGRRLLFVVCMILVFKGIPSHGLLGDWIVTTSNVILIEPSSRLKRLRDLDILR